MDLLSALAPHLLGLDALDHILYESKTESTDTIYLGVSNVYIVVSIFVVCS